MTTITLKDAGYVARDPLFEDLNLTINPSDRVGIVAQNGAGKTTLLRCLAGALELTSGVIHMTRGTRVGLMAQDIGSALGCGAHVISLRRTRIDQLTLDEAITLETDLDRSFTVVRRSVDRGFAGDHMSEVLDQPWIKLRSRVAFEFFNRLFM